MNGLLVLVFLAIINIVACSGGGGGGGDATPTPNASAPGQPTGVSAAAADKKVTVYWTPPSGTISSYTVYYSTTDPVTTSSPTKVTGIIDTSAAISGLINGTTYFFIVTAINADGEGAPSTQVSATPILQGSIITSPTASPIAAFTQSVASKDTDTYNEIFPGMANIWTIDQDFSLVDGFDLQFIYAMGLTVSSAGSTTDFPPDQKYDQLTFYGPVMGAADGVKVAAVSNGATMASSLALGTPPITLPLAGNYSAFLNATSDSRLQQTVDLTSVTGNVLVSWRDAVSLEDGALAEASLGAVAYTHSYRVVVRKMDGSICQQLAINPISTAPSTNSRPLNSQCTGTTIVLSFEEKSMTNPFSQTYAVIDNVSIKDSSGNGTERVTNGDFETGDLTGWTTNAPAEIQNMTSGVRTIEGLDVKRSFYTVPNKLWGRWVDVFENHTASAIGPVNVTYTTVLGSGGSGIIYNSPGTNNKAITSWDPIGGRDVGWVLGNAFTVYTSATDTTGIGNGSDTITATNSITVPAGGRVSLVNFIIMDGTDTGLTAATVDGTGTVTSVDTTAKATDIDTEAANITTNFWTDDQYRAGMTQDQIDAVRNMPN